MGGPRQLGGFKLVLIGVGTRRSERIGNRGAAVGVISNDVPVDATACAAMLADICPALCVVSVSGVTLGHFILNAGERGGIASVLVEIVFYQTAWVSHCGQIVAGVGILSQRTIGAGQGRQAAAAIVSQCECAAEGVGNLLQTPIDVIAERVGQSVAAGNANQLACRIKGFGFIVVIDK